MDEAGIAGIGVKRERVGSRDRGKITHGGKLLSLRTVGADPSTKQVNIMRVSVAWIDHDEAWLGKLRIAPIRCGAAAVPMMNVWLSITWAIDIESQRRRPTGWIWRDLIMQ